MVVIVIVIVMVGLRAVQVVATVIVAAVKKYAPKWGIFCSGALCIRYNFEVKVRYG